LLLRKNGQLFIEAEGFISEDCFTDSETQTEDDTVVKLRSVPIDGASAQLPVEIINYVTRTRRSLVLNDATNDSTFTNVAYIVEHHPKSILCTPLINQGELLGLIYLENNLMTDAFPPSRVEVVNHLGIQATISIANAQAIVARTEQEHLRLENEFLEKQSDELAKINANKDKFFSIVAHDLKSPFQPLLGLSELMPMMADTLSPDDIREMGESINRSAKSVYTLLENLLEWSRMQMGRMSFEPVSFDLKEVVDENVQLLTDNAIGKGIKLRTTMVEPIPVFADRNMITAVIRNLISNALKFTPRGGTVSVKCKTPPDLPGHDKSSKFVQISVIDTGVGIAKKNLDKLFKIEVNYTTTGTDQEKGTGLGLILSQEMVERNGGQIWVESEIGQCTSVNFTIPISEELYTNSVHHQEGVQ
jgi:signal transduction histidine kinase